MLNPIDPNINRTSDLRTCSAVSQRTAPPQNPFPFRHICTAAMQFLCTGEIVTRRQSARVPVIAI